MNILNIIESSTGNQYKRVASTHGGEYKGPCPWCKGENRFSIHPNKDHYVCRRCKRSNDTIGFLMDYHNMSYYDACSSAGVEPSFEKTFLIDKVAKRLAEEDLWTPRLNTRPPLTWQSKAEAIAFHAFKNLMSSAGKPHREYLHTRGLTIESIKQARIGYNPTALSFDRESWGIPPELAKNGTQKNVWIPEGFIIPLFHDNKIIRMRIRQADPGPGQRYILVAGSSTEYMSFPEIQVRDDEPFVDPAAVDLALTSFPTTPTTSFLVESELDAILCNQEFGSIVSVYAIGNTTTRPDTETHAKLTTTRIVLCLDNDAAGAEETAWWKKQYGADKVESHPVPIEFGKDPGEAYEHGFDLKTWGKSIAQHGSKDTALKQALKRAEEAIPEKATEHEPTACLTRQPDLIPDPKPDITPDIPPDPIPAAPPESCGKLCLHGHYCVSAKDGTCLVSKQRIFDLSNANGKCPKDYWYSYSHGHGAGSIQQIIYGVNFKRFKMN